MDKSFTCKEFLEQNIKRIAKTGQTSDAELKSLLTCRANGEFDFILIDIREMFEYSDASIKGCDMLLPTSSIHMNMDKLDNIKDKFIVLYCRTGNRTDQMLFILRRMGFKKISHLTEGIVQYSGEKLKNAPIPENKNSKSSL
ncbi:rhodanese-like domain-containing protein [Sulfurospirillum arcachonense]|uniref:rhodanese-like domain-containing protein n=1 Tax=Sulfurospirillum arcachonense TaxID=57666 RepID=UPI00046AF1C0|nr:rhodanese-like domain-containing protein [Sulfurospirillum arcachonense]